MKCLSSLLLFGLSAFYYVLFAQEVPVPQQSSFEIGEWQLSAQLSSPLRRNLSLGISTPDSLRAAEAAVANNFIFPLRRSRTVEINNEEIAYFADHSRRTTRALNPSFWFTSRLTVHRQFLSGISLGAGLSYGRRKYTRGVETVAELPDQFDAFIQSTVINHYGGIEISANYHLWAVKRFQLYGGVRLSFLLDYSRTENPTVFTILGYNYTEEYELLDRQRERTIRDNSMHLHLGMLYRLSRRWSLGLETVGLPGSRGYGSNFGLEVRYWFQE